MRRSILALPVGEDPIRLGNVLDILGEHKTKVTPGTCWYKKTQWVLVAGIATTEVQVCKSLYQIKTHLRLYENGFSVCLTGLDVDISKFMAGELKGFDPTYTFDIDGEPAYVY